MNEIAVREENSVRRLPAQTEDVVPILDTAKFEHMQRVAQVMAATSMIPEALYMHKVEGKMVEMPANQVVANCFLVVNQAVRWGMDPFAVAQCVSVVHGKLCYEGKLVAAVLDAKLGVKLHHHFTGDSGKDNRRIYISDQPFEPDDLENLQPGCGLPGHRMLDGSVGDWKTTNSGSPWTPKNFDRMLRYRGARDWARFFEPATMLGVYSPDEMLDLGENMRANRARDVSPDRPSLSDRLKAKSISGDTDRTEGFDHQRITSEIAHDPDTGEISEDADVEADADEVEHQDASEVPVEAEDAPFEEAPSEDEAEADERVPAPTLREFADACLKAQTDADLKAVFERYKAGLEGLTDVEREPYREIYSINQKLWPKSKHKKPADWIDVENGVENIIAQADPAGSDSGGAG